MERPRICGQLFASGGVKMGGGRRLIRELDPLGEPSRPTALELNKNELPSWLELPTMLRATKLIDIYGTTPELRFTETDQTDPAGRWRGRATDGDFLWERAYTANWASRWIFMGFSPSGKPGITILPASSRTFANVSSNADGVLIWPSYEWTTANYAGRATAIRTQLSIGGNNNKNLTGQVSGIESGFNVSALATGAITFAAAFRAPDSAISGMTATSLALFYAANQTGNISNLYGLYIESMTGGATINRAIYVAGGITELNGNLQFGAALDIVITANTAAALEFSDGTTKLVAIDSRTTAAAVYGVTLNTPTLTIASAANAWHTILNIPGYTLNLTGAVQVTQAGATAIIGGVSIAGAEAVTVDFMSTLSLTPPVESTNVTLTDCIGLRVSNPGGTPTNLYGIRIEALSGGTTRNDGIWILGANPLRLGNASVATGLMVIEGATSGSVTLTVAAAAGTWTWTVPTTAGTSGQQLQTDGAGVTSWAAAGSLRAYKNILGELLPQDALDAILHTTVYRFHYRPGMGTLDTETEYAGLLAEEAPWAMHYRGSIVNPVSTLGYMVGGFKAMQSEIDNTREQIAAQEKRVATLEEANRILKEQNAMLMAKAGG